MATMVTPQHHIVWLDVGYSVCLVSPDLCAQDVVAWYEFWECSQSYIFLFYI
jgi:hypothetical protein